MSLYLLNQQSLESWVSKLGLIGSTFGNGGSNIKSYCYKWGCNANSVSFYSLT